ncbi:MAG: hypothetical protein A2Y38_19210 [Spirochaetes bacterium GWB1_59_5]|nr:MAG: hypothetical protein A2Y38_19210 [Spirochaetes bacterium GWB1_59_5]
MKITKFDNLTTDELLQVAYSTVKDDDELTIALLVRLADTTDELDQYKVDYENEVADAMVQIEKQFAKKAGG